MPSWTIFPYSAMANNLEHKEYRRVRRIVEQRDYDGAIAFLVDLHYRHPYYVWDYLETVVDRALPDLTGELSWLKEVEADRREMLKATAQQLKQPERDPALSLLRELGVDFFDNLRQDLVETLPYLTLEQAARYCHSLCIGFENANPRLNLVRVVCDLIRRHESSLPWPRRDFIATISALGTTDATDAEYDPHSGVLPPSYLLLVSAGGTLPAQTPTHWSMLDRDRIQLLSKVYQTGVSPDTDDYLL